MVKNTILLGDGIELLKQLPDECVDLILADLPYGTTKAKWDKPLDLTSLWVQYERIIKQNGSILLFAQTPFDKVLGASNLKLLRYEWIWEKTQATGHFNAKRMPMKAHENILVFYKHLPTYNPQKTEGHKPINSYTKRIDVTNKTELYGKVKKDVSGGGETDRYPRDILKFKSDKQKNKLNGNLHSTQKPLELIKYLIKTYTNPGDFVVDNVVGSGQTCLGAQELGRDWLGIELDPKWYEISCRRLGIKIIQ